jgi:ribosomal protein L36
LWMYEEEAELIRPHRRQGRISVICKDHSMRTSICW